MTRLIIHAAAVYRSPRQGPLSDHIASGHGAGMINAPALAGVGAARAAMPHRHPSSSHPTPAEVPHHGSHHHH